MSNIDLHSLYLKYDTVGTFHEGLVLVSKAGKYFQACEDSTPAYSERYDHASDFSEGLAVVRNNGLWFHIRHDGKPAYSERYAEIVLPFCNGQALVSTGTVAYSISRDGKKIIEQ